MVGGDSLKRAARTAMSEHHAQIRRRSDPNTKRLELRTVRVSDPNGRLLEKDCLFSHDDASRVAAPVSSVHSHSHIRLHIRTQRWLLSRQWIWTTHNPNGLSTCVGFIYRTGSFGGRDVHHYEL